MTLVQGYTKTGADAAFAPIGHTHEGGGVAPYPFRRTIFQAASIPRTPATGQIDATAINWSTVTYESSDVDGVITSTTTKPDWGGYATSGLVLTDPTLGAGVYDLSCDFSFGLPVGDSFDGVAMRFGYDPIDPVFRYFPSTPNTTGMRGVIGGFVRKGVKLDNDDGCRLAFKVYGDPLSGVGTVMGSSDTSIAYLRVIMERRSDATWAH